MALSRPLFVGFSSASKVAREGGDLDVTVQTARGPVTFTLSWFFVRQVDALLERWRREKHEATLLTMNAGNLGATLVEAAAAGGVRDATFLLVRGADVDYLHFGWTALPRSAQFGHLQMATVLLDAGAADVERGLLLATAMGRTAVAALLLDRGADVNHGDGMPLRHAISIGNLELVRLLLDRGAVTHGWNNLAVRMARDRGYTKIVALLVERGAAA